MKSIQKRLPDEAATEKFAAQFAEHCRQGGVIWLIGELGAGKTAFCRALLRHLGYQGSVKSPTYTLVEPYELADLTVYHFDLYRVTDAEELEFMGIRDYFRPGVLCLIEWPQNGQQILPQADVEIQLHYEGQGRVTEVRALTLLGETIVVNLADISTLNN